MKVCEYCMTTVLESKLSWDYHNHPYDALKPLPKDRCVFCAQLREDVKQLAPSLNESDYTQSWPLYRWSIRSLAKIRESPETVVVTFRYVSAEDVPNGEISSTEHKNVNLPTRVFYLFPDRDLQPLPAIEELGTTTNPATKSSHLVREWVQRCDSTHTDCMRRKKATPKAKRFIPTRLLDISGPPGSPIKVVETATTTIQGPYCSLSHCWGLLPFIECTLRDYNKKHFTTEGVAWNLLTTNFQQAIEIARYLDVSYIWIDSMCIIQGSAEDWEHEASRMHLVYRNSYCNIAIVDAADKNGGAFRNRVPENIIPTLYEPKGSPPMFGGKNWRILPKDLWESELLQSYLYVRAWVFQERMLAPRILHFAKNQVFWDCPSLSACEALPSGLPRPMDTAAGPDRHWRGRLQIDSNKELAGSVDQPLSAYWQTAVRKYTSFNITNRSDKLIALWGIAKLIKDAMYVEYAEGLWEENLEDQICWRVAECKLERRPITPANRKIPSWSWASMDGEIIVADRLSDEKHWTVRDHNGRHLTLDLVGVKRYARPIEPQTDDPAPFLQRRVKSDSVIPTKTPKVGPHLDKESHDVMNGVLKIVDDDAEPALHSNSIPIQGHVNSGFLEYDSTRRAWLLRPCTGANLDIEAYPDTIPGPQEMQHHSQFVVMSAKKVTRPRLEAVYSNVEGTIIDDEIAIEGLGILVETVDDLPGHYRRTGGLRFRVADREEFNLLLRTTGSDKLSSKDFDATRGRKFWLD